MTSRVILEIDAKSNVQAIVDKINQAFGRLDRTARKTPSRVRVLDDIDKAASGIERSVRGAIGAFSGLLPGLGPLAGIGSLAGIGLAINKWATYGNTIVISARQAGLTTQKLQELRAAAGHVGIEGDAATDSFVGFGQALYDAFHGRNSTAREMMRSLQLDIKMTNDGMVDTLANLMAVSDKLRGVNPQLQQTIVNGLHLSALLPLVANGSADIEREMARARAAGAAVNVQAGQRFYQWMDNTENMLLGTFNSIVGRDLGWFDRNYNWLMNVTDFFDADYTAPSAPPPKPPLRFQQRLPTAAGAPALRGSLTEAEMRRRAAEAIPGIRFTGGGRTPERNRQVGGVENSMHLTNEALDFTLPRGMSAARAKQLLAAAGLPITEWLDEKRIGNQGPHMHWGWRGGQRAPDLRAPLYDELAASRTGQSAGGMGPQARVVVEIRGAPSGSTARVAQASGITVEPRIDGSMPHGVSR